MTLWQHSCASAQYRILRKRSKRLATGLGAGEQQAICLALASPGLLVIDDQAGRKAAQQLGIAVTGTVGVLLKAKQDGHISLVRPIVLLILRIAYAAHDSITVNCAESCIDRMHRRIRLCALCEGHRPLS